ncbi:hypothetical protein GJ496_001799, partial [Pomphorhynchus laevis]
IDNGFDPDCWHIDSEQCMQNLLHKAIDINNEEIACFLIENGADMESYRTYHCDDKTNHFENDLKSPLHLACQFGLLFVVECLLRNHVNPNCQDIDGNTPLHLAIEFDFGDITRLLLAYHNLNIDVYNKSNLDAFALALKVKNFNAVRYILERDPKVAERLDRSGYNFLHQSVINQELEAVLFLLGFGVDVNSKTRDKNAKSALHLAAEIGDEILLRNLLLAGANINDFDANHQTPLHIACVHSHAVICSILLEQPSIDEFIKDRNLNNALHIAAENGHYDAFSTLVLNSCINPQIQNGKYMNVLHIIASYVTGETSVKMLDVIFMKYPDFNLDAKDIRGFTALHISYINGNGLLCRALVALGASISLCDSDHSTIFDIPMPSLALLHSILDTLKNEPRWAQCDHCMECKMKFTLTSRRHHCRHCGRILCKKCSELELPIPKFNLDKTVRVCQTCFDFLTMGLTNIDSYFLYCTHKFDTFANRCNIKDKYLSCEEQTCNKLDMFNSMNQLSVELYRVCMKYAHCLEIMALVESDLSQIFRQHSMECDPSGAEFLSNTSKLFAVFSTNRASIKEPINALMNEVRTFKTKAIADTFVTIKKMQEARSKYNGILLWMKKSTSSLDPENIHAIEKYRKVQSDVKKSFQNYEQLKRDVCEKVNMLFASRCSMFSNTLAVYLKTLKDFYSETHSMCDSVLNSGPGTFRFSIIKDLNELSNACSNSSNDTNLLLCSSSSDLKDLNELKNLNELYLNHIQDETNRDENNKSLLTDKIMEDMKTSNDQLPSNFSPSLLLLNYDNCDILKCFENETNLTEQPSSSWPEWLNELGSANPDTDLSHIFSQPKNKQDL